MTGHVEIPEAAVEAARRAYSEICQQQHGSTPQERFGAAISAALPYLVPAEPAECHRCGGELRPDDTYTRLDGTMYHLRSCPDLLPAPAGDGGLGDNGAPGRLICGCDLDEQGNAILCDQHEAEMEEG